MSKLIKVQDQVYKDLDRFRFGRQTFSQVIADLLSARLKTFELLNIMEGQLKFREWQREQLDKALESQRR